MADPAIAYTLPMILLNVTVIVPRFPGSNITNTNLTVIQSPSQIELATLPDGYVAHPYIEAAYKVHLENVTWEVARERCISEGAHLAVIDTFLKFEFMMTQTSTDGPIWVGIHSMYDDTKWVSASEGSTLRSLPWAVDSPKDGYDCVTAWGGGKRGLTNYPCNSHAFYYVCEVPIPGNYNGCKDCQMAEISIN